MHAWISKWLASSPVEKLCVFKIQDLIIVYHLSTVNISMDITAKDVNISMDITAKDVNISMDITAKDVNISMDITAKDFGKPHQFQYFVIHACVDKDFKNLGCRFFLVTLKLEHVSSKKIRL